MLDERLLKLGMIWQWKAKKGSPYQEDLGTYGDALSRLARRHDSSGADHHRAESDVFERADCLSRGMVPTP